jgi:hypothetical protein
LRAEITLPNRNALFLAHPNGKHWVILHRYKGTLGEIRGSQMTPIADFVLPARATSAAFSPNGELLIGTAATTTEIYRFENIGKITPPKEKPDTKKLVCLDDLRQP